MKRLQVILFVGILAVAPFTFIKAQNSHAGSSTTPLMLASNSRAGELNSVLKKVDKAGFKAMKDFTTNFKDASDVKWCAGNDIIFASFHSGGINTHVMYSKNGR